MACNTISRRKFLDNERNEAILRIEPIRANSPIFHKNARLPVPEAGAFRQIDNAGSQKKILMKAIAFSARFRRMPK